MYRRQALNLLGTGLIGAFFNAGSPAKAFSAQSAQPLSETVELERRVYKYLSERRRIETNFLTEYHKGGGADFLDRITGKDMEDEVTQRMRKLYETDPEKVEGKNPGDIFSDIVQHVYDMYHFGIEGRDFAASVEVKIYRSGANYQELDWNNPKNHFKLTWTDLQWENKFADNGIDGIVDESSTPVTANRQQDFLQYLQRIEDIFLKGV